MTQVSVPLLTQADLTPAPDPLYLRVLRATVVGALSREGEWTEAEWVEVGDLVAELAVVDASVETTRLAFAWARQRPTPDSVASDPAREVLWGLLCASASLPPTIFQRSTSSCR